MFSHSNHPRCEKRWYMLFLLVPIFVLGVVAIVMLLWNALLPGIFHNIGTVTYWQAFGIFILARILFGGFHHGHGHRHPYPGGVDRLKERWNKMSEEEREKIKEEWKKNCPTDKQ